jgi:phytoene synthase
LAFSAVFLMSRMWRAEPGGVKLAGNTISRHRSSVLSPLAALVRRHDPDRFLTALFAPPPRRESLFLLYAFNHELARAREVASQPTLALIRLQWWREVVEGAPRRHEVAGPLRRALAEGVFQAGELLDMIAAREREADPAIETYADWLSYLRGGAGSLAVAAGRLLGASQYDVLRSIGAAYAVAGLLRSEIALARQGRCLLPADRLAVAGFTIEKVIATPCAPGLASLRAELAAAGRVMLPAGDDRRFDRKVIAAALPGVLARRDLRLGAPVDRKRGLGDRLAVVAAAWRQRV